MKKAYYYLFYKLYKFWETSFARFWSDFKDISIVALEIWFVISLFVYYKVFINRFYSLNEGLFFTICIGLLIINYFVFLHNGKWKGIIEEFDKLPRKKNIIGGIVVWSIIILIISNLIYSFYLMSQVDWSQYK